jgi:hypothetical protein
MAHSLLNMQRTPRDLGEFTSAYSDVSVHPEGGQKCRLLSPISRKYLCLPHGNFAICRLSVFEVYFRTIDDAHLLQSAQQLQELRLHSLVVMFKGLNSQLFVPV